MHDWETQVVAAAARELLGAFRSLARDGFGLRDRALLSAVIRDLLAVDPNVTRAEATLKAVEAAGARPSSDYFVAKNMLDAVKARRILDRRDTTVPGRKLLAGPPGEPPPSSRSRRHPKKR
jgi:hypothetical protein